MPSKKFHLAEQYDSDDGFGNKKKGTNFCMGKPDL